MYSSWFKLNAPSTNALFEIYCNVGYFDIILTPHEQRKMVTYELVQE